MSYVIAAMFEVEMRDYEFPLNYRVSFCRKLLNFKHKTKKMLMTHEKNIL